MSTLTKSEIDRINDLQTKEWVFDAGYNSRHREHWAMFFNPKIRAVDKEKGIIWGFGATHEDAVREALASKSLC